VVGEDARRGRVSKTLDYPYGPILILLGHSCCLVGEGEEDRITAVRPGLTVLLLSRLSKGAE
jgi:hypothetical protein